MTYVTLIDGTEIDLFNPNFEGVRLESFGLMLYRQLRYNGATRRPYCVLEHTIRGVRTCMDQKQSPGLGAYWRATAQHFLLHDMHEIVTGDIAAPVANYLCSSALIDLKCRLDEAIRQRFAIDDPSGAVKECVIAVDQCMFQREWIDLMPTKWESAAPGGCHDGPVRDFMSDHQIHPETIEDYPAARRSPMDMVGEFCHLWRAVQA